MASDNKYDRQLRLWGAAGQVSAHATSSFCIVHRLTSERTVQTALMESRILLLTASATGTETLKNLVLPGCGFITVVDADTVSARDVGNNFFVTAESIGKPRAQVALELLLEMNDDVKGDYIVRDPLDLILNSPDLLSSYTLIIATQLPEPTLRTVAQAAWARNVPLLAARTYGLLGYLRVVKREHVVLDSKSDTLQPPLRIARPFPSLLAFARGIDLQHLDDMTHGHVPYVVLLIQALQAWKAAHGGASPRSSAEKESFKASVCGLCRGGDQAVHEHANFQEALKYAYLAWQEPMSQETKELLHDPAADVITASTPDFWLVMRALRDFVGAEGCGELPVPGAVPDMTATTDLFLALQRTYTAKAAQDAAAVQSRVCSLLTSVGRDASSIGAEYVSHVCKQAGGVRVLRYRSLEEEYGAGAQGGAAETVREELGMAVMEVEGSGMGEDGEYTPAATRAAQHPLAWYLALRATDRFALRHGRYPGAGDTEEQAGLDADAAEVAADLSSLVAELGLEASLGPGGLVAGPRHAQEMARCGGAETHAVAAIIGGVAAQEAVKLLTGLYVPMENTFIHNGIAGVAGSFKL